MYKMSQRFGGDEALAFAPENQDSVVNFLLEVACFCQCI